MIIVYGIKNCDTVKKALKWLTEHNIQHKLHDYRVDGLDTQFLQQAEAQFGWENLVNKRSTTWRNLDENVKNTLSKSTALSVLADNPVGNNTIAKLQDRILYLEQQLEIYKLKVRHLEERVADKDSLIEALKLAGSVQD